MVSRRRFRKRNSSSERGTDSHAEVVGTCTTEKRRGEEIFARGGSPTLNKKVSNVKKKRSPSYAVRAYGLERSWEETSNGVVRSLSTKRVWTRKFTVGNVYGAKLPEVMGGPIV